MSTNKVLMTDRIKVRERFGKTETDIKRSIDIIKEWLKTQKHLPEFPNDSMIEFCLGNCKFSIENAKENIDMYYSIRSIVPEFYKNMNPRLPENANTWNLGYYCLLPKLTENLNRIILAKFNDVKPFSVHKFVGLILNIFEVRMQEDLCTGVILLVDLKDTKMDHVMAMTPMVLKKVIFLKENVGKDLVKEIHLINVPSYAHKVILLVKTLMKKKLADRIFIHDSIDKILDQIPQELLPSDYGGSERPLDELWNLWKAKLENYQERFDALDNFKVNEDLRPEPLKNSDILGYFGSFKQLEVD